MWVPPPNRFIHPTAQVEQTAVVGEDSTVWHFTHVDHGAQIGKKCGIGQGCYIGKVTIGDGCRIQNSVSVYEGVTLEDEVFLGPSCVFTNVKHPRAHVPRKGEGGYAKTRVGKGATVGANATVVCGIEIGPYAMIGAGAVVTHDVPAHALVVGVPARRVGWACRCGETLPEELACQRCGDYYVEADGALALRA